MFTPAISVPCFCQLYGDHAPSKVMVREQWSDTAFTLSVFDKRSQQFEEQTREITVGENGFRFFDAPIDAPYYYCIIGHHDNSYDAIYVNDESYHMDLEEAMNACDKINNENASEYEVVIRRN
jgi:hypothetical protein